MIKKTKIRLNLSIRQRIYLSFSLLVFLFVLNGIITIITLDKNKKLSEQIMAVNEPSLQLLDNFNKMVIESKMYSTNWVFLRFEQTDKNALIKLHTTDYTSLKSRLNTLSVHWKPAEVDTLHKILKGFEQLLSEQKVIMGSLKEFEDYDDPAIRLEAERIVDEEIIPQTATLVSTIDNMIQLGRQRRIDDELALGYSSMKLRTLIILLAVTIICAGVFFSIYMTRIIISPINRIRHIVNELGKGITRENRHNAKRDEIGKMVLSVNNLSEKLKGIALFAHQVGLRNFDVPFRPLGEEDALGKALILMRDNIKSSDEKFNQAQHIAHLGSWERDVETDTVQLSDELFNIFDIDPASFDSDFKSIIKLIHPADLAKFKRIGEKYLQDRLPNAYEIRIVTAKGVTKNVFVQVKVVLGSHGAVSKTVGTVQDITERKKVEEQIKLSNERYELVTKTTNDMIWDLDLITDTIFRSENYSKLFGVDDAERNEVGKWFAQVHPDDKERISNHIRKKLDDPDAESWEAEFRYYRQNGEMAYLYDRGYIMRDENKKPIRMVGATCDITERKEAEMQLHKSEERYRMIVETADEGIWLVDENNKTSFVNKRLCEILGYSPAEIMGKEIFYFMDEDGKKILRQAMERRKRGASESLDFKFINKMGEGVWIYLVNSPLLDDDGKYIGALAMVTDITERKKAEEALSDNELRFRTLTENAPVGIFQTDTEGKTIYVNETWLGYTGMSFEEATGEGWTAALHPDDRKTLMKDWNEKSKRSLESKIEFRFVDKAGNIRWVIGHAVPIFNKSGEMLGHIGTLSEITERKLAIEALQQSEIKYRQIVETAQEGIWVLDENNYTVFVNKKLCEMLEYSEQEIIGKQNYFFKNREEREKALEQIERRKRGISENHDSTYITKSGNLVWGHVSSNPMFNEDGTYKGALAMITNITQRKLNEELLRESEAKLEIKNNELESKNKELEQFAYVASHDLQEPLRTTSSFVKLFQQQYKGKLDEKADKYLAFIVDSTDRMKVLINDLLAYSRIGNKKEFKQVDCNVILTEVLADIGTAINEAGAEIKADRLPIITGYATEIKQLFQNLVVNAIKFMKKDTTAQIKISAERKNEYWQFAFTDNGIGIAKQHSERIFVIFQRLHGMAEYAGSGIGLSYCKKIVELHQGQIWVESIPGEGSTFYFTMPAGHPGSQQKNIL